MRRSDSGRGHICHECDNHNKIGDDKLFTEFDFFSFVKLNSMG